MAKKLDYEYCKAAPVLEWIGNKWALVVLVKISENEPVRFNELYRNYNTAAKSNRFGTQDKPNKNVIRTWATTQEKSIQRISRPK